MHGYVDRGSEALAIPESQRDAVAEGIEKVVIHVPHMWNWTAYSLPLDRTKN
jgi:hypothetical protein